MGRKLDSLSSLFFRVSGDNTTRSSSSTSSTCYSPSPSWAWPSCKHPRTDSFRAQAKSEEVYKTVNSVYFDSAESCSFTHSSSESFSTATDDDSGGVDSIETVIRGLAKTDRLFVEPRGDTSSILEEVCKENNERLIVPFKEHTVVMAMESEDPYRDFRVSMEEMVVAHGMMKDWECLEELLVWYLKVNGKKTHGYIVGAFVDLLVGLGSDDHVGIDHKPDFHDHLLPCRSSSLSSISFEIEEVDEGCGSC